MIAPRRFSRTARGWLSFLICLVLGDLVTALLLARHASRQPNGAYVVADHGPVEVHVGFRSFKINSSLGLRAGENATLREGERATLVLADGTEKPLHHGETFAVPKPAEDPDNLLAQPMRAILSRFLVLPTDNLPSGPRIPITSPVNLTRYRNPVIDWEAEDNELYDVGIADPNDPNAPVRELQGVRPPLSSAQLKSSMPATLPEDRIFVVIVRPIARETPRGVARFLTAPDAQMADLPTDAPALLLEAVRATTATPARTGDAWLALERLPDDWKKSELAVRLRLKLAIALGAPRGFTAAREDAKLYLK